MVDISKDAILKTTKPLSKILLVEDNRILQKTHRMMLQNLNFEVDTACNAREAFKLFEQDNYETALIDIGLPDISGIEIARLFRKHNNKIKIIMTSTFITEEIKNKCIQAGGNILLPKPINLLSLTQQINPMEL